MSKHRRCDARCHRATRDKCSCWCGGIFHGAKGEAARETFREAFGADVPAEEPEQGDLFGDGERFMQALARAREAHAA